MRRRRTPWFAAGVLAMAVVAGCASTKASVTQGIGTANSPTTGSTTGASSSGVPVPATTPATAPASSASSDAAAAACLSAAQAFAIVMQAAGPQIALDSEHGYGCLDGWAYVNYHHVPEGNHATKALQYLHGSWVIGDRVLGCGDGTHPPAMPPAIMQYGCAN
ncbi:MAG TPA: hypothetical protein VGH01_01985 [Jatrophihabitantaceae bacterium]|jgi:hypothetical protein